MADLSQTSTEDLLKMLQGHPDAQAVSNGHPGQQPELALEPEPTQTIRRTGFAGQVGDALSGASAPGPLKIPTAAEVGRQFADEGRGVAVGVPSGVVGMPGDFESFGRHIISKVAPISAQATFPTSQDVGNAIAGEPSSPEEAAGRMIGNFIGPGAALKAVRIGSGLIAPGRGAGASEAARAAHEAGYVLPPAMVSARPGVVSQGLAMLSGKVKLQQAASAKNQDITNRLAAEALGLHGDTPMTGGALNAVRKTASEAYKNVANSVSQIVPDEAFKADVSGLGPRVAEAAKAFPGLVKNDDIKNLSETLANAGEFSPQAGLELVRHLRADAAANLKAFSDPGRQALGLSQRQAAEAVDNLIERNLTAVGKPDLVKEYRDMRQLLARSYDVEAATNAETGNVNARIIGALAKKGRPLMGQLRDIANAARAFPKAMQNPEMFGGTEGLGILDAGAAAMSHGATLPVSIARPAVRSALLSSPYQNMLMRLPNAARSNTAIENPLALMLPLPNMARPENPLYNSVKQAQ